MKKNIKIIIFIGIVISIIIYLSNSYKEYNRKMDNYGFPFWLDTDNAYVKYKLDNKKNRFTKEEFEEYFKNDTTDIDYLYRLGKMNYNITFEEDSVFIYDLGFDNIDDNYKQRYFTKDVSFMKSLYIKGDVLLYKNKINPDGLRKGYKINFETSDSIPSPPAPIPQYVLDSLNNAEIDSVERINFINNYGKNK